MRIVLPVFVAFVVGCAGLARPPERHYRVSAIDSTPMPYGGEEASYSMQLGGEVEYTIQASVTSGEVRLRTAVRNGGSEPVQYDLGRMVVAAADGGPLRLVGTEEELSSRPTDTKRASEGCLSAVCVIAPGHRNEITRRYVLANGLRHGRDIQLLARLSIGDVVNVGARDAVVKLRLEEMR